MEISQKERRELILASYGRGWLAGLVVGLVIGGVMGWVIEAVYILSIIN